MARSMASISTWVSTNLIRARSALSRSNGAARVLAKVSRSSAIRSRAFFSVSSRSLMSAFLSVGRASAAAAQLILFFGGMQVGRSTATIGIGASPARNERVDDGRYRCRMKTAVKITRKGSQMTSIDPLTAGAVMIATAATDAVYVMFTSAVVARKRVPAASWSSIWYLLSSYAVISYTENWVYVAFAAAGSWVGAYASITYLHRPPGGPPVGAAVE